MTNVLNPSPSVRRSDVPWILTMAVVLLLPVKATAAWLNGAYTATEADLVAGVWIFKLSVVVLGGVALLLSRVLAPVSRRTEVLPRPTALSLALLGSALVVSLGLRFYRLDTELWVDEILMRARYIPLELRQLVSTYDTQNHQPLYAIMSRLAFLAAGETDWSVRIPAALFGVASLVALWSFARRVTSTTEALLAVVLLAVSYHHVWFSQNARGYTAMLFFAVIGTRVFVQLCHGERQAHGLIWSYGILMSLAVYTHLTAALIAIGHAIALAVTTRWTSRSARDLATWPLSALVLSAVLTVTFYAPMLPQVWRKITKPTMDGVAVEWTGVGWMLGESARVLSEGIPGGLVTVFAGLLVLGVGATSYWRQSRVTTLVMFLPVAVTFVAIVLARHNLWPRFFFFASGFLVLAAIRGGFVIVRTLVRWHPDRVAVAGACGVALLSLLTVPRAWQPKQQFRAAFEFIQQERRPGDQVIALDVAARMYLLRGWTADWKLGGDLAMIGEWERTAQRTWVVYTLPIRLRALMPELFSHVTGPEYRSARTFSSTVGGGEIYVRRHDSTSAND